MIVRRLGPTLALLAVLSAAASATPAAAQSDPSRTRLAAPVKVKQGMANVPALSPLWLLPEEAAKYNVQVEQVIFQRFADERLRGRIVRPHVRSLAVKPAAQLDGGRAPI